MSEASLNYSMPLESENNTHRNLTVVVTWTAKNPTGISVSALVELNFYLGHTLSGIEECFGSD